MNAAMTNPLKFSIITCTWNSVATLADTINSVQGQDYPHVEQIFVDGGSTDGTLEMIALRCPLAIVLKDVKGGISRAMNAGIEAATGDVVAHLHSDDYYESNIVLSKVAESIKGHEWAFGQLRVISGNSIGDAIVVKRKFSFFNFFAGRYAIPHPATFVLRSMFAKAGGFDEGLKYAMDIDLWLRLLQISVPVIIEQPLAVFRDHPGSVSSSNKYAARREDLKVRLRYFWAAPIATMLCVGVYLKKFFRLYRT